MISAIIIDDEEDVRESLKSILAFHCPAVSVVAEAWSVDTAIKVISEVKPDLIFLDIMIEGGTGFDVINEIERSVHVIFISAHNEFASEAFRVSAIDYLLKPIDPDHLIESIEKYQQSVSPSSYLERLTLLEEILKKDHPLEKIAIPELDGFEMVRLDDLIYCKASRNYTELFLNNRSIVSSKNLKYYESILSNRGFMRLHNSFLVNLSKIIKYFKGKGGYVEVVNGDVIEVSKHKKAELLKQFR